MPKLVLEPIKAEKPKKKKKKREAPGENHFADRQARIDEYNRIQALTDVEEAALKRELREKEVAAVVEKETREKEEAKAAKRNAADAAKRHRPTFVRTLDLKHYAEVKWRRMSVLAGLEKDAGSGKSKKLGYVYDQVSRGKLCLDKHQTIQFFEKINGVSPPDDALVHIGVIKPNGKLKHGLPRDQLDDVVANYKEYMDKRKDTKKRHKAWVEQFTLFDVGEKGWLDEAETEKMVCAATKTRRPDEWALRKAYNQVGGKALRSGDVEAMEEKELIMQYAPAFLDAYVEIIEPDKLRKQEKFARIMNVLLCCFKRKKKKKAAVYAADGLMNPVKLKH